jgi:hypothetical protein
MEDRRTIPGGSGMFVVERRILASAHIAAGTMSEGSSVTVKPR